MKSVRAHRVRPPMSWMTGHTSAPIHGIRDSTQRRVMQRVLERFWSPFCQRKVGADLHRYAFKENLDNLRTCDGDFTCQVNDLLGGAKLMEDFFIVLLSGFDILSVQIRNSSMSDAASTQSFFKGEYTLAHSRSFIGWHPNPTTSSTMPCFTNEQQQHSNLQPSLNAQASALGTRHSDNLLSVPFSARMECTGHRISHMVLRSPALDVIARAPGCPPRVAHCLANSGAMNTLVSLRRANVQPEFINDHTLCNLAQKEVFASAVDII